MSRHPAMACAVCVILGLAFVVHASSSTKRTELGHVQVKSLVLVDDEGNERASLKIGEGGGVWFELLGGRTGTRVTLHAPKDPEGQSSLVVRAGRGGKIEMATGLEHGSLRVRGDTRGSLLLTSRPDKPASIWLNGQGGLPDALFDVSRECEVRLVTIDEDQKHSIHIRSKPRSKDK